VVRGIGITGACGGALVVVASALVGPIRHQEIAGIGFAVIMTGLMVLLLGNYLRHASELATGPAAPLQPSSEPTTDTNDTISPG
jgi:hypothetical protein